MLDVTQRKLKTTYANLLPPLTSDERDALAQSIANEGVRVPILVDEDGEIIDGKHRYEIDQNCPQQLISGLLTPSQKKAAAIRFNIARRNMTAEQREALAKQQRGIAQELATEKDDKDAPRWSQADIGTMLGASQPTIVNWLDESLISSDKALSGGKRKKKKKAVRRRAARTKLYKDDNEKIWQLAQKGIARSQIAADFGVSVQRIGQVIKSMDQIKVAERQAEQDAKDAAKRSRVGHIITGDFREKGDAVADNSVDLIFTDPPYDRKTIAQYGDLARFAERVLVDGGSLITFVGHYAIPEVLPLMSEHLKFWWINALVHTHGNKTFPGKFVHIGWKPLLWFVKNKRMTKKVVRDCIIADVDPTKKFNKTDKSVYHEWAQGQREAAYYIENLSRKRGLIVDPYTGGGTTGVCAITLGRRFVGFEINARVARKAEGRIVSVQEKSNGSR